ncbi:hypothetical protein [Novosphingobium huizhouense]|uniref:hypothetical protein n=1 Tax=Novosphingobium huizhouense TaxID=2866625 RepID=UPI001CD8E3B6|nr:hypothetical protein [Novosphingobium huizhouense]
MAKSEAVTPTWVMSLGAMLAADVKVRAMCTECSAYRDIDLYALAAKVGGAYSLLNRRCRCRLTDGCTGWNRFYYLNGRYWPMWNDAGMWRWLKLDEGEARSRRSGQRGGA